MKTIHLSLLSLAMLFSSTILMAKEIKNTPNSANVGRVVEFIKLVNKADIQVNIVVTDNGGSTDVSPTQELFFNLYSKGEMFSTDASFALGSIYALKNATRLSGGIYAIEIVGANAETAMPEDQTLIVDAQKAIISLKNVKCEDFDCDASKNFQTSIDVKNK